MESAFSAIGVRSRLTGSIQRIKLPNMTKPTASGWREARRQSAREAIVDAAWELAREEGLLLWSLRDLARQAGITTPTVYAYFDSKHAIFDAMFGQAATDFAEAMARPYDVEGSREQLYAFAHRFFDFCASDVARYQLLFQRTIPGFTPTPEAYAPSVRALTHLKQLLADNGIAGEEHLDLATALVAGLVSQQISNDPGGVRWLRLVDEAMEMFLAHCQTLDAGRSLTSRTDRATGVTR
jgi:AcrR family transcriptional regulator